MAWLDIPGNDHWEYSTAPNDDKRPNDSYDYDVFANHILGVREYEHGNIYVLSRQKGLLTKIGYGEIWSTVEPV
jgi:hypothetical protein